MLAPKLSSRRARARAAHFIQQCGQWLSLGNAALHRFRFACPHYNPFMSRVIHSLAVDILHHGAGRSLTTINIAVGIATGRLSEAELVEQVLSAFVPSGVMDLFSRASAALACAHRSIGYRRDHVLPNCRSEDVRFFVDFILSRAAFGVDV
jgi:hypothetical protein